MEWILTRILGRFTKAGICREAAYLNPVIAADRKNGLVFFKADLGRAAEFFRYV
jgi:hypothetical protein